jgi:hypothetical protein
MSCQVKRATRSGSDIVAREGRLVKGGFFMQPRPQTQPTPVALGGALPTAAPLGNRID